MPAAADSLRNRSIEIAAQPKNLFALIGANLHLALGRKSRGTLVIAAGKIAAIGAADTPIPPEAQTIEMSGLDIWPGMVDAGSTVGLYEIGSLTETQDAADAAQFQPELRSSTALHPDSEHIPVTRANGILTSFVEPTGGTIAGQGGLINLNGWVPRSSSSPIRSLSMSRSPPTFRGRPSPAGLARSGPAQGPGQPGRRMRRANGARNDEKIKELFKTAVAYDAVVTRARPRRESTAPDARLEHRVLRPRAKPIS